MALVARGAAIDMVYCALCGCGSDDVDILKRDFCALCWKKNSDFALDFVPLRRNFAAYQFYGDNHPRGVGVM